MGECFGMTPERRRRRWTQWRSMRGSEACLLSPAKHRNRPGNVRTSVGWLRPGTFDVLVIVYFAEDMRSAQAWTMAPELVREYAQSSDPERGAYRLTLTQRLLADPRVREFPLELPL